MRIPASGGTPTPATRVHPGQEGHDRPQFISEGRFLFHAVGGEASRGIFGGTIRSLETRRVLDAEAAHLHVPSGHLVFVRNETLMAQRFDDSQLAVVGAIHTLARAHRR